MPHVAPSLIAPSRRDFSVSPPRSRGSKISPRGAGVAERDLVDVGRALLGFALPVLSHSAVAERSSMFM